VATCTPGLVSAQRTTSADIAPTPLPGLVARGESGQCSRHDEPSARALWARMSRRYSSEFDSASLWTTLHASSGYVDANSLFRFDTASSNRRDGTTSGWNTSEVLRDSLQRALAYVRAAQVGPGGRGMAGRLRASLDRYIGRHGYASPTPQVYADLTQISAAWSYPPLDGELASHFVSELFGLLSVFQIETGDGPLTIVFCTAPRFRSRPYISGRLVLATDTSLAGVQWRFHTSAPREDAGGEDHFYPLQDGVQRPLLVREGDVYRRHEGDRFFHRRLMYAPWAVAMSPLLPDSVAPGRQPPSGGADIRMPRSVRKH
jgi:hypothetical protein